MSAADKLFVTADHHFGHKKIIELQNRPFESIEQMNELLIFYWNEVVRPQDTVIHLGDLCMGGRATAEEIIPRLNGKILLVRGNHDYNANFYRSFGDKVSILPHAYQLGIGGFLPWNGVVFSHKPIPLVQVPSTMINIHGHTHTRPNFETVPYNNRIDVGVDGWDFRPQTVGSILRRLPKVGED